MRQYNLALQWSKVARKAKDQPNYLVVLGLKSLEVNNTVEDSILHAIHIRKQSQTAPISTQISQGGIWKYVIQ